MHAVTPLAQEHIISFFVLTPKSWNIFFKSSSFLRLPSSFSIKLNGILIEFFMFPHLTSGLASGVNPKNLSLVLESKI
jgi:hypothetical protein